MTFTNETTASVLDELARVKAERDAWAAQCLKAQQEAATRLGELGNRVNQLEAELVEMKFNRDCVAERLRGSPELREVVSELRVIRDWLVDYAHSLALKRLTELLRRLDRESQEGA